jgi:hypothetical protein
MPSLETIMLALIALLNAYTAWTISRAHAAVLMAGDKIASVAHDVHVVEKATNSMKDALVAATSAAANGAGYERGRLEGEVKAAAVAEGRLQGIP